ncbi:hypothetical protein [Sneathiella limimaris]|uniref:hypothetical protein n=1 Tax=Sneathiella limimaris TaxID=1964213 RepID=UPI00146A9978|nr:hypothetical protein [Sneathiella limimaris]
MPKLTTNLILFFVLLATTPAAAGTFPAGGAKYLETCRNATEAMEKKFKLPKRLLNAISLTETGRWHKASREIIAWPWTVYSEGRGRYLPNKEAAIAEVQKLRAKGVKNIDVGCMQVNLYWHPEAFDNLEDAFDPKINANYAGSLLKKLQREHRSWTTAVAYYHSQTRKYYIPYRKKVMKIWQEQKRKDSEARMAKAREAYKKRREMIARKMAEQKALRLAKREGEENS